HAGRIVDDDEVESVLAGVAAEAEPSQQQADQQDQQAAQREQDELLDDELAAVALLRLEEELHRRPADALEAHAVDEVDQHGRADQRAAGRHEPGVCEFHSRNLQARKESYRTYRSYRSYRSYKT